MKVKLSDVINIIETSNAMEEWNYFYDKEKNNFVSFSDEMFSLYENSDGIIDEEMHLLEKIYNDDGTKYIRIPSKYEINEYGIIQEFIDNVNEMEKYKKLMIAVKGKGAFRKFKDTCYDLNIINEWYEFKNNHFKHFAKQWCLDNNIFFEE